MAASAHGKRRGLSPLLLWLILSHIANNCQGADKALQATFGPRPLGA